MGINRAAMGLTLLLTDTVISLGRHIEHGFRGIRKHLVLQDGNGNKMLERPQLEAGFEEAGINLTSQDFDEIYQRFDFNDDGSVNYDELLHALRRDMSARNTLHVRKLFSQMDPNQNQVVYLADIAHFYRAQSHPKVMSGESNSEAVTQSLIDALDCKKKSSNGLVTFHEFADFFCDASQMLQSEAEFADMMEQMWGVTNTRSDIVDMPSCSSMARSQKPRRTEELSAYSPSIRLPPHQDPSFSAMAHSQFNSKIGDHNINSPNRANCGQGTVYNREKPIRRAPEMSTYCAADLRPDLVARFPERGSLDPANRTTCTQDAYGGKPFAPRVAQSTWKSEDALRRITSEYDELAGAPLVTTEPSSGYATSSGDVYKQPDMQHFVEVGTAAIPAPRDRFRGGYSQSMNGTFSS